MFFLPTLQIYQVFITPVRYLSPIILNDSAVDNSVKVAIS